MGSRSFISHIDPSTRPYFARSELIGGKLKVAMPYITTEEILAECERCRTLSGGFTSWAESAAPTLEAALRLRYRIDEEPSSTMAAIILQAKVQGRKRLLSQKKLDLLCVYECCEATNPGKRKECSRFANVVRLGFEEKLKPNEARAWLATKSLNEVLSLTRISSQPQIDFAIKLQRTAFPLLAAALKKGAKGYNDAQLMVIIKAAAQQCEDRLTASASTVVERSPHDQRRAP